MVKISKKEYETLKSLDDRWKWIARDLVGDDGGDLFAYSEKPYKSYHMKDWGGRFIRWLSIDNYLFQFIQWEDEEPYNIQELIEEYEYSAEHAANVIDKRLRAIGNAWKESEGIVRAKLRNLTSPKSDVDQAYKDGYETGKQHTYYKGYLEGLADKESINPERSPEVDRHKELLDELNGLYTRKNQDYGNSFDESLDEDGLLVLKIRLGDKYKRFSQLINQKNEVIDESMRDTLIDLANYALMGVMWMDSQEEEE